MLTEKERRNLADALIEWRFICAVRHYSQWNSLAGIIQQGNHSFVLNRLDKAS